MTPMELIYIIDSGMVEELTMYFHGHKTVVKILDLPEMMPDYQIARIWNSESGKGISVLLADKSADCLEEDAKQASIPYSYQMPKDYIKNKLDYKCDYPDDNYTSISTGYAQFTAEDMRSCDNCKYIDNLPSHNGTMEYTYPCSKCIAKDKWERDKE